MVSEERLRYIFADGATKALEQLGWTKFKKEPRCVFTKGSGNVVEILVFRKSLIVTKAEVSETLSNTSGISFEEFLEVYVRIYDGEPPLVPL